MRYITKGSGFVAGDIVLWDGKQKVVVAQDKFSLELFPSEKYTPIGIVVAPESHMPDGRPRMMSLKWMSCDDPENGSSTNQQMIVGRNITGLPYYKHVPITYSHWPSESWNIDTISVFGSLPSNHENYNLTENRMDPGTNWDSYDNRIMSPYALDGTPNWFYRATEYSGGTLDNPLTDFDGKGNTDVMLAQRGEKDYATWKPTYDNADDFPAVSCCDMYHTVGTKQGDWYLPSVGEFGYAIARLGTILESTIKVGSEISVRSVWSSTQYSEGYVRTVGLASGSISSINSDWTGGPSGVLAFSFV